MIVRIHGSNVPAELREISLNSWEGTIEELIKWISGTKPAYEILLMERGDVRTDLNILVNGRHCMFIDGLRTKIKAGDKVDILLPVIGG